MLDNRIPYNEVTTAGDVIICPRPRDDQTPLTKDDYDVLRKAFREKGVICRPPTFTDTSIYFSVKRHNIVHWWVERRQYLSPKDYERSINMPTFEITPGAGNPSQAGSSSNRSITNTDSNAEVVDISDDDSDMDFDDDNEDDDELPELEAALNQETRHGG